MFKVSSKNKKYEIDFKRFVFIFFVLLLAGFMTGLDLSIDYQERMYNEAVSELSQYAVVIETTIPDSEQGNVVGQTQFWSNGTIIVLIEIKDPFVVYHEMGHVLHPEWNEEQCDNFAILKTGDFRHWKSVS